MTVRRVIGEVVRASEPWGHGLAAYVAGTPPPLPVVVGVGQAIPRASAPAVGGIGKLQEREQAFTVARYRFNVLYLVTSRLPHGAVTQARWAQRKGARV